MAEKPLLDSNTAPKKLQQHWTGHKQGQRPQQTRIDTRRAYGSDSIALVTAAIAVHSYGMRASALCSATSKAHSWGGSQHCLDTIFLNLRRGHLSRFGAQKHIDPTRSVARPWPRLRPPTLPLWSSCILHPKLANFDERGQPEVIFGLTAHGEKLNLVAVGLVAQQLVIKLVHDRHLHLMRGGAEGLPCTSCRPKRFLIEGFGTTHTGAVEFAFIRNVSSSGTSSAKIGGRDTSGSAR